MSFSPFRSHFRRRTRCRLSAAGRSVSRRTAPWPAVVLLLGACAQPAPNPDLVRICDDAGCSDRPAGTETFVPGAANSDPDGRIAALERLARNDPRAAYDLGLRYFRGDGVRRDSYRALQWMRDAAERGDLDAQKAIGRLSLTGLEEMGADPREAEKWLTIAAGRGDREAAKLLAEASEARRNEDAYYRWRSHWQPVFYRYWAVRYPYRWVWRNGAWSY